MSGKRFTIELTISEELTVDEVWPDGDAPENPTDADVLALLEAGGSPLKVARDWNLIDGEWAVTS